MYEITCPCGKAFEAQRPHAKYCTPKCRSRGHRAGTGDEPAPVIELAAARSAAEADETPSEGELVDSVRRTLAEAERLETWQGQQALELARGLRSNLDTGSSKAALHRELRTAMAEALRGASHGDVVDELKERMKRKMAGGA